MKRKLLLGLGFLFLALWVAALFYPVRLTGIHLALIVALLFFIRSVMVVTPTVTKKTADKEFIDEREAEVQHTV